MTLLRGFYAQRRARMLAQLTTDLLVLAWAVVWWFVGRATERTIDAVATPGAPFRRRRPPAR